MEEVFESHVILRYDEDVFITFSDMLKKLKDTLPKHIKINHWYSNDLTITIDMREKRSESK